MTMLPLLMSAILGAGAVAAPPADPTYMIILDRPEHFAADIPLASPDSQRQVGWGTMLFTLRTPVEGLRKQVEDACDITEKTGYPLLLHFDDWNFPPDSHDPDWVEWTGFPKPGETHGPLVRRRWLNWGSWNVTGPPPDFESPKFRAFMRKQVGEGIVKPLAERVRKWRAEGKGYLFAGLVDGWETGYYSMLTAPNPRPTARETFIPNGPMVTFEDSEVVNTGYAALTHRGYTAEKLAAEAKAKGISKLALFHELMSSVVHDYVEYVSQICADGGIPRDRIYTHLAGMGTLAPPQVVIRDGRLLPVWVAINPYSRPGLTMTSQWASPEKVVADLHAAGRKEWGAVELEVTPQFRSEKDVLGQLDSLSAEGARVMCLFGWSDPGTSLFAVKGSGAPAAIRRWLSEKPAAKQGP